MTRLLSIVSALAVSAGFAADVQGQTPVATGNSANWKIAVVKSTRKPYSDRYFELVLVLRFEYVGPAGDVAAPLIAVVDEKGEKYTPPVGTRFPAIDTSLALWLHSSVMAEQRRRPLTPGARFGVAEPLTYEFVPVIPTESKELKLLFADVPPIALKPAKPK